MAEAFGVNQELQVSGFQVDPNNIGVTRPRGIDTGAIGQAGKAIAKGLSDLADNQEEANIVRSIASARDKMRAMEAAGKTPVEIGTFRDEAASAILNRFPTTEAVNLINSGLRQSRAQSVQIRADGTPVVVDENNNPIATADFGNADLALQSSLMTHAVTVEADMPAYTDVSQGLIAKAAESGADISGVAVGNISTVSKALGTIHTEQATLQLTLANVGPEQGGRAIERARNNIMGAISSGLLELEGPAMIQLLESGAITAGDVRQVAQAYVKDMFKMLSEEEAFGLLEIAPHQFRERMNSIVNSIGETANAAFSRNNDLLNRKKVETELRLATAENDVFLNLERDHPDVFRLLISAEGIKNAAESVLLARQLEALYRTSRSGGQRIIENVLTALMGRSATIEASAAALRDIKRFASDERGVSAFMRVVNNALEERSSASLLGLQRAWDDGDGFNGMRVAMREAGREEEFNTWFGSWRAFMLQIDAIEQQQGKTLEQHVRDTAAIREEATGGAVIPFLEELFSVTPRESDAITEETTDGGTSN